MEENSRCDIEDNEENAIDRPKLEDFVKGFKFRYRGKPYCWLLGDGEYIDLIERDFGLLEDEWHCGYITSYAEPKCSVKVVKTGECCPEKPTKEINGDPVCDRCYDNWKHLEDND